MTNFSSTVKTLRTLSTGLWAGPLADPKVMLASFNVVIFYIELICASLSSMHLITQLHDLSQNRRAHVTCLTGIHRHERQHAAGQCSKQVCNQHQGHH